MWPQGSLATYLAVAITSGPGAQTRRVSATMEQGLKRPHSASRLRASVEVAPLCPEGELIMKPETGQLGKRDLWRGTPPLPRLPERQVEGLQEPLLKRKVQFNRYFLVI